MMRLRMNSPSTTKVTRDILATFFYRAGPDCGYRVQAMDVLPEFPANGNGEEKDDSVRGAFCQEYNKVGWFRLICRKDDR